MARRGFPLKTGVKVLGRGARSEFFVQVQRPTWQVRRAEFDEILLRRAIGKGVVHRLGAAREVIRDGERVVGLRYRPADAAAEPEDADALVEVRCRVLADASGHSAFLSRAQVAGPRRIDAFNRQVAAFSQFRGAVRDPGEMGNNTFIFYGETYHWAWFIPLSPEITSVGVVVPAAGYKARGKDPEALLRWGLDEINPDLRRRMAGCERTEEVRFVSNYSYRIEPFAGDGWLCVGDAHRFTDPIFSFGVSLAMAEARAAARAIREGLQGGDVRGPFERYAARCDTGQEAAYDLIRYFWKYPAFFGLQARGAMRRDFVQLLAGDVYGPELPALAMMRNSLHSAPLEDQLEGRPREVVRRVMRRFALFQGVEAAYLETPGDGIRLSFVLSGGDDEIEDALHDFEERLVGDLGREDIAVMRWSADAFVPDLSGARVVFDRRSRR